MDDDLLISIPAPTQDFNDPSIIKIIGVGGGGGNAVANMYREQINGVRYVVCNTDSKALSDSPVPHRVQIGPGWGAGGKPEIGRKLAEENIETIQSIYDEETKMALRGLSPKCQNKEEIKMVNVELKDGLRRTISYFDEELRLTLKK